MDPATVAVFLVGHTDGASTVRRIEVHDDGSLDYWPRGVFSEDFEVPGQLTQAQWRRQDTAGAR